MINPFFTNKGPIIIENLLSLIDVENSENYKGNKIFDIKDLVTAKKMMLVSFIQKNMKHLHPKPKLLSV